MSASDKLADILRAIQGSVSEVKTNIAVNRMGTMTEVEDGAGRVLIDGMDDDTPCSLMVNANVGDRVTVEIVGNAAKVTGNYTAPPTDDTVAEEAKEVAEATNQHFFTDTNGIHVTEATQEDWEENHSGANVLINSLGQLFRNGLNNLVCITSSATQFYDGLGNAASNIVAQFGRAGTIIGKAAAAHISITNSLIDIFGSDGSTSVLSLSGTTSTSTSAYMSMLGGQGVVHTYQDASGQIHLVLTTGDEVSVNPSYRMAEIKMSDAVESGGTYGAPQIDMTGKVSISDDLTLGTQLGISNGGTGLTSSPSLLVNLGSTSAASVLQATPRPGITGTLGASHGGTGQTSLQATRNAMGLGNTTGALPIANGGTGKTTAADARAALGITRGNLTLDSTGCTTHTFFSGLSIAKGGVIGTNTGIFDYRFFYVTLARSGWCICYRSGSSSTAGTIRGVGAYNDASITYLYEVTIAVSTAGRLTLTVAARHKQLGSSSSTPDGGELNLTGVYGIY